MFDDANPSSSASDGSNTGDRCKRILGRRSSRITSSKRCFEGRTPGTVWQSFRAKKIDLDNIISVSYTHLDVYKRQPSVSVIALRTVSTVVTHSSAFSLTRNSQEGTLSISKYLLTFKVPKFINVTTGELRLLDGSRS